MALTLIFTLPMYLIYVFISFFYQMEIRADLMDAHMYALKRFVAISVAVV